MARLLVVDDDPKQLELRTLLLGAAGHEVRVAETVDRAIELLAEQPPEVVLMDLRLPDVSGGLALIRGARGQPVPPKIIVLSGWPGELLEHPEADLVD